MKIGHLLALSFGEAGSKIIADNLNDGDLNPMMAGIRCHAIFLYNDIKNFISTTECLQEKVFIFANSVSEICHSCVDKFGGSANRNVGDAYLCVWKFKDDRDFKPGKEVKQYARLNTNQADLSIFSVIKIISKINKYTHMLEYRNNELLNQRMPGYQVKLGFGLH